MTFENVYEDLFVDDNTANTLELCPDVAKALRGRTETEPPKDKTPNEDDDYTPHITEGNGDDENPGDPTTEDPEDPNADEEEEPVDPDPTGGT